MQAYETAANAHNLEGMLELISEDAVFLFSNQTAHLGKAAIRTAIQTNFEGIKAESYRISNIAWLVDTPDVAVCVYEFDWSGEINGKPASGGGRGSSVIRRIGDHWRIMLEHLSAGRLR